MIISNVAHQVNPPQTPVEPCGCDLEVEGCDLEVEGWRGGEVQRCFSLTITIEEVKEGKERRTAAEGEQRSKLGCLASFT